MKVSIITSALLSLLITLSGCSDPETSGRQAREKYNTLKEAATPVIEKAKSEVVPAIIKAKSEVVPVIEKAKSEVAPVVEKAKSEVVPVLEKAKSDSLSFIKGFMDEKKDDIKDSNN